MATKQKTQEPFVYLAKSHPQYGWEESRYVAVQILRRKGFLPSNLFQRFQKEESSPLLRRNMEIDVLRSFIDTIKGRWIPWQEDVPVFIQEEKSGKLYFRRG